MRVNVLGTIEVNRGDTMLRPAGAGQRALLAALTLEQGKVVPVDRLIRING
jgi:DNA-binding SARP family transcriptional activator